MIQIKIYFKLSLSLLFIIFLSSCDNENNDLNEANKNWPSYMGGKKTQHYSPLNQINVSNVKNLKLAWEYSTNDFKKDKKPRGQIQCNPLIINGIMYGTSPKLKLFAINAKTAEELWVFNPNKKLHLGLNVNRGISYWKGKYSERILYTVGSNIYCLDAKTGKLIQDFGYQGKVSLKDGIGEKKSNLFVVSTSPGIIYRDKIIMGTRVSENANAAKGHIQAINVVTGMLEWVFHTIPEPGEYGYDEWPKNAYKKVGGANSWAGMSLDVERGIVYAPTGSASFDFYGGNRKGSNLFANCVLALNANTGERVWHYQITHHDLWDRDVPAPPTLVTVTHKNKATDAVAVATKTGHIFLLDRDTGTPLFPVEERPVPKSDIPGEETSPTQPFPLYPPPFTRQKFTVNEITNISKEAHDYVQKELEKYRTGGQYIPPSLQGTIVFPEFNGGASYGGAAYYKSKELLIINAKEKPAILTLKENKLDVLSDENKDIGESLYNTNCSMCHGENKKGNPSADIPSLIQLAKKLKKENVLQIVKNGQGGRMPGFGHLSNKSRKAIVNYLFGIDNKEVDPHEIGAESNNVLPYSHTGYNRFLDQEGYPAIKPPWGTLTAINLKKGSIEWQVPLGEYEELTAKGIPKTGRENLGGPVVTAGGLIFIAATSDEYFRAFDIKNGNEVWKYKLPAAGYAVPSVYEVDGVEYVVIACGGGKFRTKSSDKYLAFSLK